MECSVLTNYNNMPRILLSKLTPSDRERLRAMANSLRNLLFIPRGDGARVLCVVVGVSVCRCVSVLVQGSVCASGVSMADRQI